jgi:protein TonB
MKNKNSWASFRFTNLLIGLVFSLIFCLMAFNYTLEKVAEPRSLSTEWEVEDVVEVIRTVQKKKKVEKIPLPEKIEPIKDPIEVDDQFEFIQDPLDIISNTIDSSLLLDTINMVMEPKSLAKAPLIEVFNEADDGEEEFLLIAETMPYYGDCNEKDLAREEKKYCSDRAFMTYLRENIKYPQIASRNGIEGTVILNVFLNERGEIENVDILRNVAGGCGEEALRVVKSMQKWSPARQRGRAVKILMRLPVRFELQ